MATVNTKALSGFLELLPHEQVEFDRIKSTIEATYHQFGFTSLDTPAIERSEILLTKGSSEADKQVYFVQNGMAAKEADALAMRFDLTIPLARYVANHFNDLSFPFRRSHIGKVYRGERAQRGRFREFYQCDIDVIGRNELNIAYDAELPAIIYQIFKKLDFGKFTIKINNRKVLNGFFAHIGVALPSDVLRVIDKADKITHEAMLASFVDIGLNQKQIDDVLDFMNIKGSIVEVLQRLNELRLNIKNEIFSEGVTELKAVADLIAQMGVEQDYYTIDLALARGLDYYTGTVYETVLDNAPAIGSICGGGRYDNLAGHYTHEKLPGVGISIGLTRLFWQLRDSGILKIANKSVADVIILPDGREDMRAAFEVAGALRAAGRTVDVFLEDVNMKKKFQYVTKKDAPYVVVCRSNEAGEAVYSLQYKDGDDLKKEFLALDVLIARVVI